MEKFLTNVTLQVNDHIYLKDPDSSKLGRNIITQSIEMIDEMGFEAFTFRKLAEAIHSTEASIYRYFEGKHKLLIYLISWYWSWMEYKLVFSLANLLSPENRLEKAISLLTEKVNEDNYNVNINVVKLYNIVIAESYKTYHTKDVDKENNEGVFTGYMQLVSRVSEIILEINPQFKYPNMLVSTIMEGAHHQRYFADHLPPLTDKVPGEDAICEFYKKLVLKAIRD